MAGNEDKDDGMVLDIDELRAALNLDDIELKLDELMARVETMNARFGDLLVYMNMLDERVQEVAGEPVVSTIVKSHVGSDGVAQIHRQMPEIPEVLRNPLHVETEDKSKKAKMVVSHAPKQ